MSRSKPRVDKISRSAVLWQLLACVAVVLPHVLWLPAWILILSAGCIAARLMMYAGRWSFPHWLIRLLLVIAVGIGLLMTFNRDASLNAMVALLAVGLALKLLEIYRKRDAMVLLYVSLFVAATVFLFEQSILAAAYMLIVVLIVIAAMVSIWQDPLREGMLSPLKHAWRLLLPALPIMLVLFFIFPRIGPLWSVELDRSSARTGLSDSMSPGDISRLTRSDELAFRALFDEAPPLPSERYWRALVLSSFDGREWTPGSYRSAAIENVQSVNTSIEYEIVQEASRQRWLFALDIPLAAPVQASLTPQRTLLSNTEVNQRIQYRVTSGLNYRLATRLDSSDYAFYTQVPRNSNPRSQAIAAEWLAASQGDTTLLIERIFQHFNETFIYTLEPQALGRHSVDEFMFFTQHGFCEHFASATAFLLRSAGVPARIVTGYQGGEWNASNNYLTLRQYDAHAWVEVWLDGRGWVRIDPTAAVAPERIEMSADQLFSGQAGFLADSPLTSRLARQGWMLQVRMQYDSINFAWQRWVLNYHQQQQNLLQDWLGDLSIWKMVLVLLIPSAIVLSLSSWLLFRRKNTLDALDRQLYAFLKRFEPLGYQRSPDETLSRFINRLVKQYPQMGEVLTPVADAYEAYHFAPTDSHSAREALKHALSTAEKKISRLVVLKL